MLSYHLPHPRLEVDCLTNEVAQAQADVYSAPPATQLVNGHRQFPGTGKARDAEKIYKMGREVVLEGLEEASEFSLALTSKVDGDHISGRLQITGPAEADARVHIVLAEKAVLYPDGAKSSFITWSLDRHSRGACLGSLRKRRRWNGDRFLWLAETHPEKQQGLP